MCSLVGCGSGWSSYLCEVGTYFNLRISQNQDFLTSSISKGNN